MEEETIIDSKRKRKYNIETVTRKKYAPKGRLITLRTYVKDLQNFDIPKS